MCLHSLPFTVILWQKKLFCGWLQQIRHVVELWGGDREDFSARWDCLVTCHAPREPSMQYWRAAPASQNPGYFLPQLNVLTQGRAIWALDFLKSTLSCLNFLSSQTQLSISLLLLKNSSETHFTWLPKSFHLLHTAKILFFFSGTQVSRLTIPGLMFMFLFSGVVSTASSLKNFIWWPFVRNANSYGYQFSYSLYFSQKGKKRVKRFRIRCKICKNTHTQI